MKHFVVMGVSGVGKSSVGRLLADALGLAFLEGDDFHPQVNIDKMSAGQALNDHDRVGWLDSIALHMSQAKDSGVYSCSALKEIYREQLRDTSGQDLQFVYLKAAYDLINDRMQARADHFMPSTLLRSQFDTLEEPDNAIVISVDQSLSVIIKKILTEVKESESSSFENRVMKKEFGIIGLGVMGKSLARNFASRDIPLALYNRHVPQEEEKVAEQFIATYEVLDKASGFEDMDLFINALERPRKILIMVKAGQAIDFLLDVLVPKLEPGDIIIDGGNSHYQDTEGRIDRLSRAGIHYIGSGVSGGEEGALKGPSIMPGGNQEAYEKIAPYLEKIAALDNDGLPCCTYIGAGGSGHFVKMVHNGIEYGEMQLLAEVYSIMRYGLRLNPSLIASTLEEWGSTDLNSYLLEITIQILRRKENDQWLIDAILDKAGNKGTGSWTTKAAADLGVPITVLTSSLFARYISAFKDDRVGADNLYALSNNKRVTSVSIDQIRNAYRVARIINHHQGYHLISEASKTYNWNLNFSELSRVWTNGCIIRSALMRELVGIMKEETSILKSSLRETVIQYADDLAHVSAQALVGRHSIPCFASACNFLAAFTNQQSTANIIQAQRDFFGAHTYKRVDDPNGPSHHTEWLS